MAGRQGEKCNYSNYLPTHLGDHDDDMVIMKKGDEKNVIGPIIYGLSFLLKMSVMPRNNGNFVCTYV